MTNTIFSIGPFRDVHDINVTTNNGRRCTIDIYRNESGFESEVIIRDTISTKPGSWAFNTKPASTSAIDNFTAGMTLIKEYLSQVDPKDTIIMVHNPCNTPFVSETDQNKALSDLGFSLGVRIN